MGTEAMERVVVEATIENLEDALRRDRGELPAEQVRMITVTDALVDTGATTLAMPKRLVEQLGLQLRRRKKKQ